MITKMLHSVLVCTVGISLLCAFSSQTNAQTITEIPYEEDFSSVNHPELPDGWVGIDNVETYDGWRLTFQYTLEFPPNFTVGPMAIMPEIDSEIDITSIELTFAMFASGTIGSNDVMRVGFVSDDGDQAGSFTLIEEIQMAIEIEKHTISLDGYEEGDGRRIAFYPESHFWNRFIIGYVELEGREEGPEDPPGIVTLTSPSNNAIDISNQPDFSWEAAANAISYRLQISTESGFGNIDEEVDGISGTSYSLTSYLDFETNYFWRVRAENQVGNGDWSETRSFTTEDSPEDIVWWRAVANNELPPWFEGQNQRGTAVVKDGENTYMLVQSAAAFSSSYSVNVVDAETGADAGTLDLNNYSSGGVFHVADVSVSDDNKIFLSNYGREKAHGFKVFMFEDITDAHPAVVLDDSERLGSADWQLARTISLIGDFSKGTATIYAISDVSDNLARYTQTGPGDNFGEPEIIALPEARGSNPTASAAIPGISEFYQTGVGEPVRKYDSEGNHLGNIPLNVVGTGTSRVQFLGTTVDGDDYLGIYHYSEENALLVRVPNGNPADGVVIESTASLGDVATGGSGDIQFVQTQDGFDAYVLVTANGIALSQIGSPVDFVKKFNLQIADSPGWRMLSTPVEVKLSDFLDPIWTQGVPNSDDHEAVDANVLIWDDGNAGSGDGNWVKVDLETTLAAGTGVLVYVFEDDNPTVAGITGGFPKTLSVSGSEFPAGTTAGVNEIADGWSLLGNPFAGPVNFMALTKSNLSDVVYVWDPNDDGGSANPGENDPGAGSWQSFSDGSGTGDLTGGIISPFQGFFVQNNAGGAASITFPEEAITTGGSFMGKESRSDVVRLELSGQGMRNATWMSFRDQGSMDHAYGDAHQLQPLSPNYALLAGRKTDGLFDISVLPQPGQDFEFPLSVDATIGGTYTLKVTDFEYSGTELLFLEDRLENQTIRLSGDMAYEFTLERPAQKAVTNPFGLINNGPAKAVADDGDPRFVITAGETVDAEVETDFPETLELAQNYPNPFNPTTVIEYAVPEQQHIRLAVYDMLGRQVSVLVDEVQSPGRYDASWDASQLSSGVYIYRLNAGGQSLTRRMTLVK